MTNIIIYGFLPVLYCVLILLLWIVFVPVIFRIDTAQECYEVKQTGTVRVTFHPAKKKFIEMKILGFNVPLTAPAKQVKEKKKSTKQSSYFKNKSKTAWSYLFEKCLKSFKVKRFKMDVDTGDVVLNAQLIPATIFTRKEPFQINTNFYGRVYLNLIVQGHIYKLIWVFIQFLIKK